MISTWQRRRIKIFRMYNTKGLVFFDDLIQLKQAQVPKLNSETVSGDFPQTHYARAL